MRTTHGLYRPLAVTRITLLWTLWLLSSADLWSQLRTPILVTPDSASAAVLKHFGTFGKEDGQLDRPTSVAVDESGNVWVVDSGNHRIQKFSAEDVLLCK